MAKRFWQVGRFGKHLVVREVSGRAGMDGVMSRPNLMSFADRGISRSMNCRLAAGYRYGVPTLPGPAPESERVHNEGRRVFPQRKRRASVGGRMASHNARRRTARQIVWLALAIIFVLPGIASAEELLIIAPEEFMPALAPLEVHKEATGIDTVRLSLESIYANYWFSRGVDEPEQIKLAIEHYHRDHGVRYVMLVGDGDKFPVRWVTHEELDHPEKVSYYLPSDLYYADLYNASGGFDTWNYDGDEYFGEHLQSTSGGSDPYRVNADRADLHPDVAVGRVPASTVDEVKLYVAKVIKYEYLTYADAPAADWFHAVLLIAGEGRDCDPGIHFSDIKADLGSGFQYTTYINSGFFTANPDKPCRPCNCTPGEPLADCMARTGLTADQISVFEDADGFTDSRPNALFEDIGFLAWHDHGSSIGRYNTRINNANRFTVAFDDGCSDGAFAGAPPGDMPRFAPTGQAGGQDLPYRTVEGHELNVEFVDFYLDADSDGEDEKYYNITGCWVNGTYYPLAGDRCGGGWFPNMSFHADFNSAGNLDERRSPYILNPPAPAPQQPAACDAESNLEAKLFVTNTSTGEETGWIGMVGATMGTNFPVNGELESLFFKSYRHPHAQVGRNDTLGDLWWSMQEYWQEEIFDETGDFDFSDFFAKYDISEDEWFTEYCACGVQSAMKFALFGDPSLRLGGIAGLEDTEPPETTFDESGWYGGGDVIHVRLVAVDHGSPPSGVRETRCSVDNGSWRTAPVSFTTLPDYRSDGVHQIDFFSIDYLKNQEAQQHATLNIDTYPPRTTVMLDGELPATTLCWLENGEIYCQERGCYGEDVIVSFAAHDSPPLPTSTPAPSELWGCTFGGEEADKTYDFQQTLDGGFIMTGWTGSFGMGQHDVWLIKTDTNGTEQWNRTFGGGSYDEGWAVLQTDGGYLIAGETASYGSGSSDAWLIKTNSTGHELWNRTFGGAESSDDEAHAVVETPDGGYLVAGSTQPFVSAISDVWLIKTDSSGNEAWNKTVGGPAGDNAFSLQRTADNGYIIVGDTASYGSGGSDVWLIKINASGHELWNSTFGGLNQDNGRSVNQTEDGGYIIAGYTMSYGAGDLDIWLIKADGMGHEQWNRTFGGASFDLGYAVEETSDGRFILAGTITEWYDKNVWLIATNPTGTEEWREKVGGSSWDEVSAVHQTSDGSYLIAGATESYGAGDYDAWLVKIALTNPPTIAVSGIDRTEYSLDSSPWYMSHEYTGPFEVHGGELLDTKTLYYRSVDNASNEESFRDVSFCVSNWEIGRMREEARILAGLEEIIRFRMRQTIADTLPIAAVEYAVAPRAYPDKMELIGVDEIGKDGWMVEWDTRDVPNGEYIVRQTVRGFPGLLTGFSAAPVIYQEEFNVTVCNIPNASYRFELEAGADEIDQGASVQYTLTFSNKMGNDLDNLNMICDTDIGSFKAITVEDNGNLTEEGLPSWSNKHLHTGEKWTVHFKGRTKSDIRPGTVITSQALLTADTVPLLVSDDPSTKEEEDYTAVTIKLINGTINGTVRDKEYGTPVVVSVSLTGPVPQSVTTDCNGSFAFTNLPPGMYNLSVAADSYHAYSPEGAVTIFLKGLGERIQLDFLVARNDTIPPISSLARSLDEIVRDNEQVLYGTAYDFSPCSGVRVVEVCINRMNDRRFWNGSDWMENETWLLASGTTDWVFSCGGLSWDGTQAYALYSRATDYAGNVETPSASTSSIALPAPRLITPVNGSIVHDLAFEWSHVANSYYTIQVDDSPDFSSPEIDASYLLDDTTFVPGELPERAYYWRVKAVDAFLGYPESRWSEVWRVTVSAGEAFDTGTGSYPSIAGTHNGTITPSYDINVTRLYTYPCSGTGGHTEYVKIWNNTGWNVTATWNGYSSDWHNITFNETFLLKDDEEYNVTIVTSSYPQIHHTDALLTSNGWINCTDFTDIDGKKYYNWIPAIKLE